MLFEEVDHLDVMMNKQECNFDDELLNLKLLNILICCILNI